MRSYKLGEFVAHEAAVNCLRIGRNTAGVLATGGEDKKVNLWRVGQHDAPIKVLAGLPAPVECVTFDNTENQVAAGVATGTVKVWDLESGKVNRSLTGHRSNCLSVDFHPYGPFLVSGSLDTNVKVWDLRRKEAIVTFKGHHSGVRKLAVSPDGKWVCSGSEDGDIKLWDADSGRVLKEGWRHEGRVTGLEFHPAEFLLATSGADRTVKVWDLETWEQVEGMGPEATPVQAITYHRDGRALLAATCDGLKVWGLEPAVHHDSVPLDWRHLADMHLSYKDEAPRVVGCCCTGNAVGVFVVNLRKVAPFCHAAAAAAEAAAPGGVGSGGSAAHHYHQQQQQPPRSGGGQLSPALVLGHRGAQAAAKPAPPQQQQQLGMLMQHQPDAADDIVHSDRAPSLLALLSSPGPTEPEQQAAPALVAGPLTRQLPRQRTPPTAAVPGASPIRAGSNSSISIRQAGGGAALQAALPFTPGQPGQLQATPLSASRQTPKQQQQQREPQQPGSRDEYSFPEVEIRVPARRPSAAALEQLAPASVTPPAPASRSSSSHALGGRQQQGPAAPGLGAGAAGGAREGASSFSTPTAAAVSSSNSSSRRLPDFEAEPPAPQQVAQGMARLSLEQQQQAASEPQQQRQQAGASGSSSRNTSRAPSAPASRAASSHDLGAGPQRAAAAAAAAGPQQQQPAAEAADPILAAMSGRRLLKADLARMVSALQVAKGFVGRGNLEGAYRAALSQGDPALACMLVEAVCGRPDAFELGSLEPLIKLLELLLGSSQEQQVGVGLAALGLVLRGPGATVAEVCGAPGPVGVDLSAEARRSRCLLLKMALEGLGLKLGVLARGGRGATAARAQLLAEELKRIVAAGRPDARRGG